ncbi:MAG TPA: hypothetical protein VE010_06690, partial [Thermoanaerobaculia bacterium]|nr:hypothetical protein [Thermoanaerobaculia bacterium]
MDFILRILFSGLIAFVPSEDGKEVTVLLLNANHYHTSDGAALQSHKPMLLARAGNCTGDCPTVDPAIASFIYADKTPTVATDSLQLAVSGGGAWQLSGSELSVRKGSSTAADLPPLVIRNNVRGTVNGQPQLVPTNATEREDFSWVPNLKQVCANGCTLNPALLATQPPSGLIAARFRLRSGTVFTYSVARVGANVTPVNFKRLDGIGSASSYSQAVATWVAADIAITGSNVEIVEEKFAGGAGRSMMLTPDANDRIEIAVLNLPPFIPP